MRPRAVANKRGRRISRWLLVLSCVALVALVIVTRERIVETVYRIRLDSDDEQTRRAAAKRLGSMGSIRALPRLLELLGQSIQNGEGSVFFELPDAGEDYLKSIDRLGLAALPQILTTFAERECTDRQKGAGWALKELFVDRGIPVEPEFHVSELDVPSYLEVLSRDRSQPEVVRRAAREALWPWRLPGSFPRIEEE